MKRKLTIYFVFLILTITNIACNQKDSKVITENLNNTELVEIEHISDDNGESQSYWRNITHNFAKGENGYYFTYDYETKLMYFDQDLEKAYIVCNKPDCEHNSIDCNGFIGKSIGREEVEVYYLTETVYYYRGFIYMLSNEGYLTRFDQDGSGREKITRVYTYEGQTGTNLVFNEDYVYVYNMNEHLGSKETYTEKITRYSLDGKKVEVVAEYTGTGSAIMDAQFYGNQLFFTVSSVETKKESDTIVYSSDYQGLYVYQTDKGKTGLAIDKPVSGYCVDKESQDLYYYVKNEGMYKYNIDSKSEALIYKATDNNLIAELSYDGKYVYVLNTLWSDMASRVGQQVEECCDVVDGNGNIINTIKQKDVIRYYFGDDKYMFASYYSSSDNGEVVNTYGYVKKDEISTAKEFKNIVIE